MNKKLILGLLVATTMQQAVAKFSSDCAATESCDCEITSRSYMAVRPHFQSASPEMVSAFREDRAEKRQDGWGSAFQAVVFGGKTRDTQGGQRYFMPFCKTELIVDERRSDAPGASPMDLRSTHFNIFTKVGQETPSEGGFRSKICLEPSQSVAGIGLHYRHGFWRNEEVSRQWFFSVSSPLTRVKNKMKLREEIISNGGGPNASEDVFVVANMVQAFRQKEWRYGKIDSGNNGKGGCAPQTKTRFADIEAKIGMEWIDRDPCHLESYVGVLIPTGNKPKGEYLFEPIVGHGKHWGLLGGGAFGVQLWADKAYKRTVRFELAGHAHYLFKKEHVRSFDLKGKPWSRYMEVYKNKAQAEQAKALFMADAQDPKAKNLATPGINVFTQPVDVTPGYAHNATAALVFSADRGFQGEVGYNMYCRASECVDLACDWQVGPALKDEDGNGQTNPVRDITGYFVLESAGGFDVDMYEDSLIKSSDLDLTSAAQPGFISHTFYGSLGYRWDERDYPMLVSGGGSYEFASATNAMLDRWLIWGKFGVSF